MNIARKNLDHQNPGTLYVVATPIGNLGDITIRALEILKSVDLILCEDTRTFGTLKHKFDISAKLLSYHNYNEEKRSNEVLQILQSGKNVALVSDAGTPLISDPGYRVLNLLRHEEIKICPIPGPSSLTASLSVSGLETDKFVFLGFLPPKEGKRSSILETYLGLPLSIVCFESPYRIKKVLESLAQIAPHRQLSLQRELTKLHEEILNGTAAEILKTLEGRQNIKGEIVLIIGKEAKNKSENSNAAD